VEMEEMREGGAAEESREMIHAWNNVQIIAI
jgi:hypothetical protein